LACFRQAGAIADNGGQLAGWGEERVVVRVAVEVGGTFTDLIWIDAAGRVRTWKVASTPGDPSGGVIAGLDEGLGGDLRELSALLHGSTVATNAVIERTGCRAGLVTTRGFRDLLVTQRQLRDNVYAVVSKKPVPIVPLARTIEAAERMTVRGEVQLPLDEEQLVCDVERLVGEQQIEALAICLLHAYQNPMHEQQAREVVAERFPDLPVVLSSDVLPAIREYERASTTAIAAYLSPRIGRYLSHLEEYLHERAGDVPLFVMQSSGGVLPSAGIRARPVEMLQSGPAAGVIAAIRVAELLDDRDLITLDIGGTSTDVCLVRGGVAEVSSEREVDGLPVGIPSVDIANVGAGGGSLAWLDRGGMLQVGPQSAGARPGPACYGSGGSEPALTDAVVQLGWLRPAHFLGGRMALHPQRSTAALAPLADALGQEIDAAAQAMVEISVANINRAVRLVSIQRGHDPEGYALYAYGGMGALVGALVAEELRIRRVVVPPYPGLFSALGLLVADLERTYRRTRLLPLRAETLDEITSIFAGLREAAQAEYAGYGYGPEQIETRTHLEMRYRGQGFELLVPVDPDRMAADGVDYLTQAFHEAHFARYGTRAPVDAIEVVTYRLVARVPGDHAVLDHLREHTPAGDVAPEEGQVIFRGEWQHCRFYQRDSLPIGFTTAGLAIVEEPTATTLVPPGWRLTVGPAGALVLESEGWA
jgi:N-methylhydantoinase A